MAVFNIYKTTTVPTGAGIAADTMYLVTDAGDADYMELYQSNSAGTALRRIPTRTDVQSLIASATGDNVAVADFASLPDPTLYTPEQIAFVADASGDPTVTAGAASYRSNGTIWLKFTEDESMDIDFSAINIAWGQLTGGPTSTPAQLDAAVTSSHTHANLAVLNVLTDVAGDLTYNGTKVDTTIEWNEGAAVGW